MYLVEEKLREIMKLRQPPPATVHTFREQINFIKGFFIFVGMWPTKSHKFSSVFCFVLLIVFSTCAVIKNVFFADLKSASDAFTHTNAAIISIIYYYIVLADRKFFYELIQTLDQDLNRDLNSYEVEHTVLAGKEIRGTLKIGMLVLCIATTMKFIQPAVLYLYGLISNADDNEVYLPPPMGIPVIYGPLITYIIESVATSLIIGSIVGSVIIFMLFTYHICGQFNALRDSIEHEKSPGTDLVKGEETFLDDCIRRHSFLLNMSLDFVKIFGVVFWIDCVVSVLNICFVLFSMAQNTGAIEHILNEAAFLCGGVSQMFLACWCCENILTASLAISDGAYNSKWLGKSLKFKKKIVFIIIRGQKPVTLRYWGKFVPNLEVFKEICTSAWGYFNMLRSTMQK